MSALEYDAWKDLKTNITKMNTHDAFPVVMNKLDDLYNNTDYKTYWDLIDPAEANEIEDYLADLHGSRATAEIELEEERLKSYKALRKALELEQARYSDDEGGDITTLCHLMERFGIINNTTQIFPKLKNEKDKAKYWRELSDTFGLTFDNINATGNKDEPYYDLVQYFVLQKPDPNLEERLRQRGLLKLGNWKDRENIANAYIAEFAKNGELDDVAVKKLKKQFFAMNAKDFDEAITRQLAQRTKQRYGREIMDMNTLAKQILKEHNDLEKAKTNANMNAAEEFLNRVSDKTEAGNIARFLSDFKDDYDFLNFNTNAPAAYEKELYYNTPAANVLGNIFQYTAAKFTEIGWPSKKDFKRFYNEVGHKIATMAPDAERDNIDPSTWNTFSYNFNDQEFDTNFHLFDIRSYGTKKRPGELVNKTDDQKVAWGSVAAKRFMGAFQAWAAANNIPLTAGYGEEENMVQGAQHPYAPQRERRVAAAIKQITDQFYEGTNWEDLEPDDRAKLNAHTAIDKNKFAIEQLYDNYGDKFIRKFEKIDDARFLTLDDLKNAERRYNRSEPFDPQIDIGKNKARYKDTLQMFDGEAMPDKQISYYSKKNGLKKFTINGGLDLADEMYNRIANTEVLNVGNLTSAEHLDSKLEFDQFPISADLADDPLFIQNVITESKYRDIPGDKLVEATGSEETARIVKNVRKMYNAFSIAHKYEGKYKGHSYANKVGTELGLPSVSIKHKSNRVTQGHTDDQVAQYLAKRLFKAAGRSANFHRDNKEAAIEESIKNGTEVMPRTRQITETQSLRPYIKDRKNYDPNNPWAQNEANIRRISMNEARHVVNQPLTSAPKINTVSMIPTETKMAEDAIAKQREYNEDSITKIAGVHDGVPQFMNTQTNGRLHENSFRTDYPERSEKAMARTELKQGGTEEYEDY